MARFLFMISLLFPAVLSGQEPGAEALVAWLVDTAQAEVRATLPDYFLGDSVFIDIEETVTKLEQVGLPARPAALLNRARSETGAPIRAASRSEVVQCTSAKRCGVKARGLLIEIDEIQRLGPTRYNVLLSYVFTEERRWTGSSATGFSTQSWTLERGSGGWTITQKERVRES